jgi:kynureninase
MSRPTPGSGQPPRDDELLARALALDAADPLAGCREQFVVTDPDLVYLDGNSLGRLPLATRDRLHAAIGEWGDKLIRGWDRWIGLARETGDVLAEGVLQARPGEVVLADSTSVNLYKLAMAACAARPGGRVIVTDDDNFPTDRYILAGVAQQCGMTLRTVATDIDDGVSTSDIVATLDTDVALVSLSHVAYRSGAIADLPAITSAAHEVGALTLWDLSHSAGAVPVPLGPAEVDLAVGCTYKHLHGGPGAPSFLYVRADLQSQLRQPIWGWFGERDQFAMAPEYDPADGIDRFLVGTPPVLGGYAALCGEQLTARVGVPAIHAKSRALGRFALELYDAWLAEWGIRLASPREEDRRGAHLTLYHPAAWQLSQALRAAGVIPDFRTPDRLRIGFAPMSTSFTEVYTGLARLRGILRAGGHLDFPAARGRVT